MRKKSNDYSETLKLVLNLSNKKEQIESDEALKQDDLNSIQYRNKTYNKFLESFSNDFSVRAKNQIKMKKIFFYLIMGALYFLIFIVGISLRNISLKEINVYEMATIISSLAGVITAFIVIPKIIAKNLFPTYENDKSTEIFSNMIKYDHELRKFYRKQYIEMNKDKINNKLHRINSEIEVDEIKISDEELD